MRKASRAMLSIRGVLWQERMEVRFRKERRAARAVCKAGGGGALVSCV